MSINDRLSKAKLAKEELVTKSQLFEVYNTKLSKHEALDNFRSELTLLQHDINQSKQMPSLIRAAASIYACEKLFGNKWKRNL